MDPMVGEKIRETRLSQQLSLADVAGKVNVSVATLSRIENGKQSVDVELFVSLAEALHVSPTALLGENGSGDGDPLARRIAALTGGERLDLWRDLAAERRTQRTKKRGGEARHISQQLEEMLAQLEFLREELESMRKHVRRR